MKKQSGNALQTIIVYLSLVPRHKPWFINLDITPNHDAGQFEAFPQREDLLGLWKTAG